MPECRVCPGPCFISHQGLRGQAGRTGWQTGQAFQMCSDGASGWWLQPLTAQMARAQVQPGLSVLSDCLGGVLLSCQLFLLKLGIPSHAGPLLHIPLPRLQGPSGLDLVTQYFPHSLPGGTSRPPPHLLTSWFLTQSGLGVCPRGSSALGYGKPSFPPSFEWWEKPTFIHSFIRSFIHLFGEY